MKHISTVLLFFLSFSVRSQSIVYVTVSGAGNQSGSSWANALPGIPSTLSLLQSRLASASPGTQFWIAQGHYVTTYSGDRNISFYIPSGVQVYGGFYGYESSLNERNLTFPSSTTFSGNGGDIDRDDDNSFHVVTFRNASASTRLDGVVIQRGNGYKGGGIYNDGSGSGGRSEPTIANCLITNNTASFGGGIHNDGYQGSSSPTIVNCVIAGNMAYNDGGGIYNNGYQGVSNPVITNCLSYSNTARYGGAYYNEAYQGLCNPLIQNCTIANNQSITNGSGAMFNDVPQQGSCSPMLRNCIIWGNRSEQSTSTASIYNNGPIGLTITYSDVQDGYAGSGNISQDPGFANVTSNDYRLRATSPVVNAGDPNSTTATVSATDLLNRFRVQQGRIDMGVYEYQQNPDKFFVTPTGAGNRSGSSWSNALPGRQLRIYLAGADDRSIFWLAGGTYWPGLETTETFLIPSGVQMYGGFSGTEIDLSDRILTVPSSTTLSGEEGDPAIFGDNNRHVVTFRNVSASTRLDGVVITKGNADANPSPENLGGGIYNEATASASSSPTIANCVLINNRAANGAGLCNMAKSQARCSPTVTQCIFLNNKASFGGGGVYNETSGGGVCSPIFTSCQFTANEAVVGGGFNIIAAQSVGENKPTFTNCKFESNTASSGAGIYFGSSFGAYVNPTLSNCLFSQNQATNNGGAVMISAIAYSDANPTFINCTVVNNMAITGGGLFSSCYSDSRVVIRLTNSITRNNNFASNTESNRIAPTYAITYSNIQGGFAGTGNIDADPLFVDATNGNFRLLRNSPSINTGDPASTTASVSATDLAGGQRIVGGRIDMGAYEFAPFADLRLALNTGTRTPSVGQVVSYKLTITNDGPEPATNVAWHNRLPANLTFAGGSGATNSGDLVSGTIPSLAPGEATIISYQLQPQQPGQYLNAAQITASDVPDPDSQPNSGTGDGQDDAATVDLRTTASNGAVYTSPNPNQVPLPPVQANQPPADPTKADLNLAMTTSSRTPKIGDLLTVTLRITNAGGLNATGVAVKLNLPAGTSFVSGSGFNVSGQTVTGSVGSVSAGTSATLTAQVRIDAGSPGRLTAEISASNQPDPDSQPNSGVTDGQDDTAVADLRISQ